MAYEYPRARRSDAVLRLHGKDHPDPYDWLEDPDAEETKQFVDAQNKITGAYLEGSEGREKFRDRVTELYDYPKYGTPFKRGSRYFHFYNEGLQPQSVLFVQDSLDGEKREFLNPNKLSEKGIISLGSYAFSEDAELMAYTLSESGSDWNTVHVMDVATASPLPDVLQWVKFSSLAWTHDGKGFFYNQYPQPAESNQKEELTAVNKNQKVYYHRTGTPQSEDTLVYEDPSQPDWMFGTEVSVCGRYLLLTISHSCDPVNKLYYADLKEAAGNLGSLQFVRLIDNFEASYEYIHNTGTLLYLRSNRNAPRYCLLAVDMANPDQENWRTILAEHAKDVLEWVLPVAETKMLVCYLQDVKSVLQLHTLSTGDLLQNVPLEIGSVVAVSGRHDQTEVFLKHMSFLNPGTIFRMDVSGPAPYAVTTYLATPLKGLNANDFTTEQVFYTSKDGTRIPMFIVAGKDMQRNGSNPTLLYGYGGFNNSVTPSFSVARLVFIHHYGGVLAVANIRGGGEYGKEWYRGGSLTTKQNCFDDFQAAAEYLIAHSYTKTPKLAIQGGSNGGLLVGACINQRPDLFGAAVAEVGVLDMLKFHKFTIGHAWVSDYGDPDKEEDYNVVIKYSPLHNINAGAQYPAVMLTTADHDVRVVPSHSLKFIAALQHSLPNNKKPLLIRVDTEAGHGAGRPTKKIIDQSTDVFAFIARAVDAQWHD
eukprot:comp18846_c0_seq1/m.20866 comp18846_c0_seq1/g.20866  ORF comp18846_c0_seq1/g.20866 comp18846_c0_seq1/m.20866 type:complete len:703 (-) comp18846_c0_seq1:59-2167(-)